MKLKPDSTRDRLIDAAMELFHAQGYGATGVAQILKQADCNSGSLYYCFPTKEDLLLAVLEKYKVMLHPVLLDPIWSRLSDPIEKVFGLLDGYRQMLIATNCAYGCPIGNLALELAHTHPNAAKLITENFHGWRDAVKKCLEDAGGRFPDDLDRKQLASFVLTVMEGGVMQARAEKSLVPFDAAVTQLRDYFDRLLSDGTQWGSAATSTADSPQRHRDTEGEKEEGFGFDD